MAAESAGGSGAEGGGYGSPDRQGGEHIMSPLESSNLHKVRKAQGDVADAYGESSDWAARAMESAGRLRHKGGDGQYDHAYGDGDEEEMDGAAGDVLSGGEERHETDERQQQRKVRRRRKRPT